MKFLNNLFDNYSSCLSHTVHYLRFCNSIYFFLWSICIFFKMF